MLEKNEMIKEQLWQHLQEKERHRKRRLAKQNEKKRIEELSQISWMNVKDNGVWKQRCYRSKVSKHLKKQANKKVRYYEGGLASERAGYKKIYDYWYELI